MSYKGVVKGRMIELEGEALLPEGTRVSIIPEQPITVNIPGHPLTLKEWLQEARQVRAQLPKTTDSVELLRQKRGNRVRSLLWHFIAVARLQRSGIWGEGKPHRAFD